MKRNLVVVAIATGLFFALAIPVQFAAQNNQDHKPKHHHYKLIDIGTFGGPASQVIVASNAGPIISKRGTVVGLSATSVHTTKHSHPFVCYGISGNVPYIFHGFKWQGDDVTDLGSLPPTAENCSEAQGVNGKGEIVLQSENGRIDPLTGINEIRGVLWKKGMLEDFGTFGGHNSLANQINSRGQVAGAADNTTSDPFSLYYFLFLGSPNGTQTRAFLWENGHKQDLGTLGTGNDALAVYVNEGGQVAGFAYTNTTPNPTTGFPTLDPFLWTKDKRMIDLGTLGGTVGSPNALNNRGQVIGGSNLAGDQATDAFLWDNEKLIDLTAQSGGAIVNANAINDAGEIVGKECFQDGSCHAYLRKDGVVTDLGTVNGDGCSQASAINPRSQVVGQSKACDGSTLHAFLWENGSIVDLNTLIPPDSKLHLIDTQAINEQGEIAGDGQPPGCTSDSQCVHAYLLIPCDENHPGVEGCDYSMVDAQPQKYLQENQTRCEEENMNRNLIVATMLFGLPGTKGVRLVLA